MRESKRASKERRARLWAKKMVESKAECEETTEFTPVDEPAEPAEEVPGQVEPRDALPAEPPAQDQAPAQSPEPEPTAKPPKPRKLGPWRSPYYEALAKSGETPRPVSLKKAWHPKADKKPEPEAPDPSAPTGQGIS